MRRAVNPYYNPGKQTGAPRPLHKLVMKRRRLRTERLKALTVGGENRR